MKTNSKAGRNLVNKARKLEDGEGDYSWIVNYSIKFASCHTLTQFNGEEGGGGDEDSSIQKQNIVKFKLCSSDSCGYGCKGGDYIVSMNEFVDAYTESRLNAQEMACETVRENCNCDYYDDEDACEKVCYEKAGLDYCIEEEEGDDQQEVFDLQEYLECTEIEDQNENGNVEYYNGEPVQYYVGPKCSSDGERVNLGVFTDEFCTKVASDSKYYEYTGVSLPYSSTSIVAEDCVACGESNGDDGEVEMSELCMASYEPAAKCESKLSINNKNEDGCDFIDSLYLKEDSYQPIKHSTAVTFAWVFFVSTLVLAGVALKMFFSAGQKINLNQNTEGAVV